MVRKKCLLVLVLAVALAAGAFLASDSFAWKCVRPICDANGKVTGWKDEPIPDNRVPIGVNEVPDAVGVFGYPKEEYGLNITAQEAHIDTSKPFPATAIVKGLKFLPGDELNTSGPWDARTYLCYQTNMQGHVTKPEKDYAGDFQFDLIDKEGRVRTRKVYQFRKGYYGEGGIRYKNMVYFFEPPDLRGMSILLWKPIDESQADDNWIYLPALRRVRRISAGQKMDAFGGTDMTNDQIDRASSMWNCKFGPEVDLYVDKPPLNKCFGSEPHRGYMNGKHCVTLDMTPRNKDWPISKDIIYMDKVNATWLYEETYDKGGKLIKILLPFQAHLYPKQPIYWTYGDWYAHDLRTDHKTMMYLPEYDKAGYHVLNYKTRDWNNYVHWFDVGYSDDYLSQKFMMTGTR